MKLVSRREGKTMGGQGQDCRSNRDQIEIRLYLILSGVPICLAEFSAGQIGIRRMQKGSDSHANTFPSSLAHVNLAQRLVYSALSSKATRVSEPYVVPDSPWYPRQRHKGKAVH